VDLWSNIKGQERADRCVAGLGEAEDGVRSGMDRVRQSNLPFSFLHHAGLFFDPSRHSMMRCSVDADQPGTWALWDVWLGNSSGYGCGRLALEQKTTPTLNHNQKSQSLKTSHIG
jgi:hypothetical protein